MILRILCLFLGLLSDVSVPVTSSTQCPKNCLEEGCLQVECVNGDCIGNRCECLACYSGEECDIYEDNSFPRFTKHRDTIYIEQSSRGEIYQATAIDDDFLEECMSEEASAPCPCGEFIYELSDPKEIFYADKSTGTIFVSQEAFLYLGESTDVEIIARPKNEDPTKFNYDTMILTVNIIEDNYQNEENEKDLPKEEDMQLEKYQKGGNHINFKENNVKDLTGRSDALMRRKREANPGSKIDVTYTFSILNTVPATIKPGTTMNFKLDIIFPIISSGDPLDLNIELYVHDMETEITILTICNVVVGSVGSKLTTPGVVVTKHQNSELQEYIDKADISVGPISNADTVGATTPVYTDSTITLTFDVDMIVNPSFTATDAKVTIGAEYDGGQRIWVGQATVPIDQTMTPADYPYLVEIIGPTLIDELGSGVLTIPAIITFPFGDVTVDIYTPDNTLHDQYSIEVLKVAHFGENYMCLEPTTDVNYFKSITGFTNFKAQLTFFQKLSNLEYADLAGELLDVENDLRIIFSIFAFGAKDGDTIRVGASVTVEGAIIWVVEQDITIGPPPAVADTPVQPSSVDLIPLDSRSAPILVHEGQSVTWALKFYLPSDGTGQITCSAPTPDANQIVSGVRVWEAGGNVARVPDMLTAVIYSGGGATWDILVSTALDEARPTDTSEDYIIIDVTVTYLTATPSTVIVTCDGLPTQNLVASNDPGLDPTEEVTGTAVIVGSDNTVYVGSQLAILGTLTLPISGSGYINVMLETAGDFGVTDYSAEVCRVDIIDPGRGISSVLLGEYLIESTAIYTQTSANSLLNDSVKVSLGSIGPSYSVLESENQFEFRVIYNIPVDQVPSGTEYNASIGMQFGSNLIWTGYASLTFDGGLAPYSATYQASYHAPPVPSTYTTTETIPVKAYAKLYPGSSVQLIITATSADITILEICRIAVQTIGGNFGCINTDIYNMAEDPLAVAVVTHDATDWGKSVILDMKTITNIGFGEPDTSNIPDVNTIEFVVYVRLLTTAATTLQLAFDDGRGTPVIIDVALTATGAAIAETVPDINTTVVSGSDGTLAYYSEATKDIFLDLIIPVDFKKQVSVTTNILDSTAMTICYAEVIWAGLNVPCVMPKSIVSTTEIGTSLEDVFNIDLGTVCYSPFSTNETESIIRIVMGVFVNSGVTSVNFETIVSNTLGPVLTVPIALTLDAGAYSAPENMTIEGLSLYINESAGESIVEPGLKYWQPVEIVLPPTYTILDLEFAVMTLSQDGHAVATLHGIRWGAVKGRNVGCVKAIELYDSYYLQNTSSDGIPLIHESQMDTLTVNLTSLSTSGISHQKDIALPEDDRITIEVLIMIADHVAYANGDIIKLNFAVAVADERIAVIEKSLTLLRTGSEIMVLQTEFIINTPLDIYPKYGKIDVTTRIYHVENDSQVEAYDATVRYLMPNYVSFCNATHPSVIAAIVTEDSMTSTFTTDVQIRPFIDMKIDYLFFTDVFENNMTLTIDPTSVLPIGLETLPSTLLLRLVCRESDPANPLKYCMPTQFVNYQVAGTGCNVDLEIENYQTCQFSASTAIDTAVGPEHVADTIGWSPAVRDTGLWQHHITVDFLLQTRLTRIEYLQPSTAGKAEIDEYKLMYSLNGFHFMDACPDLLSTAVPTLPSNCVPTARYTRIVIVSTMTAPEANGISVRFKLFGCNLGETPGTCTLPPTKYTRDAAIWRQALDDPVAGFIYFCDYSPYLLKDKCYCSADGSTWTAAPIYITHLLGYDSTNARMCAFDKNDVMVCTVDCNKWNLISSTESAAMTVTLPKVIPGEAQSMADIPLGAWTADFHGLKFGDVYKVKWNDCCS